MGGALAKRAQNAQKLNKNEASSGPKTGTPQNAQTQRHGAPKMPKNAPKTRPAADRKRGV